MYYLRLTLSVTSNLGFSALGWDKGSKSRTSRIIFDFFFLLVFIHEIIKQKVLFRVYFL